VREHTPHAQSRLERESHVQEAFSMTEPTLTAVHIGPEQARALRDKGEYVRVGFYAVDGNAVRHLGPFPSHRMCEEAIKRAQRSTAPPRQATSAQQT
jgi:hypothetical protein